MKVLTRREFRDVCFGRDKYSCVVCGERGAFDSEGEVMNLDVHHIVERRLWGESGGYFEENGASVCERCHMLCETTDISCDDLRKRCGIKRVVLPEQFYSEERVDKWGNTILSSGNRLKGELFYEESVQKVLRDKLHLFSEVVKYPRTFHLPWSPGGRGKGECVVSGSVMEKWRGRRVVVTEKMDGENTSLYRGFIHARSISELGSHPSRNRIKALWSSVRNDIPDGWRLCVENCYARHSIHYKSLCDWHLLFGIWDEKNVCLSWEETRDWAELLGIATVPVLYEGEYDEGVIRALEKRLNFAESEGYVVRPSDSFRFGEFRHCVLKYVREGHVTTTEHWKEEEVVPNLVRELT